MDLKLCLSSDEPSTEVIQRFVALARGRPLNNSRSKTQTNKDLFCIEVEKNKKHKRHVIFLGSRVTKYFIAFPLANWSWPVRIVVFQCVSFKTFLPACRMRKFQEHCFKYIRGIGWILRTDLKKSTTEVIKCKNEMWQGHECFGQWDCTQRFPDESPFRARVWFLHLSNANIATLSRTIYIVHVFSELLLLRVLFQIYPYAHTIGAIKTHHGLVQDHLSMTVSEGLRTYHDGIILSPCDSHRKQRLVLCGELLSFPFT